jgi:hypothetical protein
MRTICLISSLPISKQLELARLVNKLHGWYRIHNSCIAYYIVDTHAYMLYMLDPNLIPQLCLDFD